MGDPFGRPGQRNGGYRADVNVPGNHPQPVIIQGGEQSGLKAQNVVTDFKVDHSGAESLEFGRVLGKGRSEYQTED